ncbi:MAG TPA: DUF2171 domain-containing protein [Sphingomicrobium sp.]|nr:DUF2171 domain-containing protein [Sphingomicrobium sp.]
MSYDRYDTRNRPRDEQSRWRDEARSDERYFDRERSARDDEHGRGPRDDRGFFERAGDEIASWFGEDDTRRRHHEPSRDRSERDSSRDWGNRDRNTDRGWEQDRDMKSRRSRDWGNERSAFAPSASRERDYEGSRTDWDRGRSHGPERHESPNEGRGLFERGGSSERDYNRNWPQEYSDRDFSRDKADRQLDRGWSDRYTPVTGDYGRSGQGSFDRDADDVRSRSNWAEDEYRGTSRAGTANWSDRSRDERSERARGDQVDPHYRSWRDRHLSELDRDYDDYRAENRSRFESDFGSWRERRQQKRGLLSQIHEHMEVVGSDDKLVGTVDKTAGDRLILTKSDPESGGIHHSISCSEIEKIDGNRVVLACTADQTRERWRDESRGRALFEQDDQGEMGPRMLNRSFEGTYR